MIISYDCSDLIAEIEQDINEFGAHAEAWALYEQRLVKIPFADASVPVELCVSYLLGFSKPTTAELEDGNLEARLSTLAKIHNILVSQDNGFDYNTRGIV